MNAHSAKPGAQGVASRALQPTVVLYPPLKLTAPPQALLLPPKRGDHANLVLRAAVLERLVKSMTMHIGAFRFPIMVPGMSMAATASLGEALGAEHMVMFDVSSPSSHRPMGTWTFLYVLIMDR